MPTRSVVELFKSGQNLYVIVANDFAKVIRMTKSNAPARKSDRRDQAKAEFEQVIENVCGRGFFGTASVTVNVQDGHIQYTRVSVERMIK